MGSPSQTISLPYHWTARPYQHHLWNYLRHGGKRAVACWHRRAGKDEICLHHTACAMIERVGNYAHMLPEYAQARKAIWEAVNPHTGLRRIDEAFPPQIRAFTRDQEMLLGFPNGSTWQVVGSDNYNSLMGTSYVGMVLSEYALSNPSAWGYFSPILMENDGWALFISTPRGHNHFETMLKTARAEPEWFAEVLTNDETCVFDQAKLDAELHRLQDLHGEEYGLSLFRQEYHCSFDAAILGAIWADCVERAEREGRVLDFDIDPRQPVDTGWDLGRTDDTAIWFRQFRGREIDVIDHHSSNLKDIEFYVNLLLEKQEQYGMCYGTHWLPHDARPRTLAAGGKSILQQCVDAAKAHPGLGRFAIAPRLDRQEGIQAGRKTFPFCRFHKTRTAKGLASLKQYHREWDDENKVFLDTPKHDFTSHDADAWRTLSLTWKYVEPKLAESPLQDRLAAQNIRGWTFGKLKDEFFAKRRQQREESFT